MSLTHNVVLHALRRGRFRAEWNDEILLATSGEPVFEACRALKARGVTGTLRMRHAGARHFAMIVDIETGAGLTVAEGRLLGPHVTNWVPFPPLGVSRDSGLPTAAVSGGAASLVAKTKSGAQRDTALTRNEFEMTNEEAV